VSGHLFQVSASGRLGRGFAAIAGPPTVDQLVIIAEDAITMRSCSRINDGKQMLADSLEVRCFMSPVSFCLVD